MERIKAQTRRQRAFEEDVYNLSENEGFFCKDCDWRGLAAEMSDYPPREIAYNDKPLCQCPECGGPAYTKGEAIDHLEQFI